MICSFYDFIIYLFIYIVIYLSISLRMLKFSSKLFIIYVVRSSFVLLVNALHK